MATIKIKGMTCRHCVLAVTRALGGIAGISGVEVDLEKGEASFREEAPVDRELLREGLAAAGFEIDG